MVLVLPLGIMALIALIPAVLFAGIRLAFVGHAIVDRPGQPFTRSIGASGGRWWAVFGRVLPIGFIVWLISAALHGAGGAASGTGFGAGFGQLQFEVDDDGSFGRIDLADAASAASIWALAVSSIVAVAVLATSVPAAAFARLYRTRNPAG